jgi:putative phosphoesterase
MRIGIISDIHDNVWKLESALKTLSVRAGALLCCGDLCSPFVIHQLGRGFPGPIHIVFGNNDADLFRITRNASAYPHIHLHGELYRGELAGRRIAMNHYPEIARGLAHSGDYDWVFYGHNHTHAVERVGRVLLANPGPVMGAAIHADGSWSRTDSTFLVADAADDGVETLRA